MARRYSNKLDSDAHQFIGYAVDGAVRMQTLINDLLAYSRVGSRGRDLEPTDCEAVLAQALLNVHTVVDESRGVVAHDVKKQVTPGSDRAEARTGSHSVWLDLWDGESAGVRAIQVDCGES